MEGLEFTREVVPKLKANAFIFYDPPTSRNGDRLYLNTYKVEIPPFGERRGAARPTVDRDIRYIGSSPSTLPRISVLGVRTQLHSTGPPPGEEVMYFSKRYGCRG